MTVPLEANIDERNRDKNNKYGHYPLDLSKYNCKLTCYEISSKGFITDKNPRYLKHFHSFMKQEHKLPKCKQNISASAVLGFFHI